MAAFFQGGGRLRLYLCPGLAQKRRFSGPSGLDEFRRSARFGCLPFGEALADAKPAGPLATYPGDDSWTEQPFADGVVLVGDAGFNNPIIGEGLSIAMRDARTVRDVLRADDWSPAAFAPYAEERMERMRRLRDAAMFMSATFANDCDNRPARRARFFDMQENEPLLLGMLIGIMGGPENGPAEAFDGRLLAAMQALIQASPPALAKGGTLGQSRLGPHLGAVPQARPLEWDATPKREGGDQNMHLFRKALAATAVTGALVFGGAMAANAATSTTTKVDDVQLRLDELRFLDRDGDAGQGQLPEHVVTSTRHGFRPPPVGSRAHDRFRPRVGAVFERRGIPNRPCDPPCDASSLITIFVATFAMSGCTSSACGRRAGLDRRGTEGPSGTSATVYTRGLSNVSALAFDADGRLWAATASYEDTGKDGVYVVTKEGATPTKVLTGLHTPLGLLWHDGALYVASRGRVDVYREFDGAEFAEHEKIVTLPSGVGDSNQIVVAPDGRLLMGVSASCDHCVPTSKWSGSIVSFLPDGSDLRMYATGIRAAIGLTYYPGTSDLFVTMNQRDDLGDATPGDWLGSSATATTGASHRATASRQPRARRYPRPLRCSTSTRRSAESRS